MFILIAFFAADAIMQTIPFSFYKGNQQLKAAKNEPVEIQINETLFGFGYNMDSDADEVILFLMDERHFYLPDSICTSNRPLPVGSGRLSLSLFRSNHFTHLLSAAFSPAEA